MPPQPKKETKRSRPAAEAEEEEELVPPQAPTEYVSRDEVADMLAQLANDTKNAARESIEKLETNFNIGMASLVQKLDTKHNKRADSLEAELVTLRERQQQFEKEQRAVQEQVGKLQKLVESAEQSVEKEAAQVIDSEEFDRSLDLGILRVQAKNPIPLEGLRTILADVWSDADIGDEHVEVDGPRFGRVFAIRFLGIPEVRIRRARKAFGCLRKSDGSWKQYAAKTPSGGEIPLFVSTDKNGKMQKEEGASRKMQRAIKSAYPDKAAGVYVVKKDSAVHVDWTPVVRFEASSSTDLRILWNHAGLASAGLDRERILGSFNEDGPYTSTVEWSL